MIFTLFAERNYFRRVAPCFAVLLLAALPAAAQTYTVTDLGTLGTNSRGSYSQAFCINANGQVAGQSSASSSSMTDPAFLYSNGTLSSIGTLGGEYGQARGINPVLVCSPQLRAPLRKLILMTAPRLPVLSYSEIAGCTLRIETIGVVSGAYPVAA